MSFRNWREPNFVEYLVGSELGRVNFGGIHQHDRDVVLNRVYTAAFAAFETLPARM